MGQVAVASFDARIIAKHKEEIKNQKKMRTPQERMDVKMGVKNNKILRTYLKSQYMWFR